MDLIDGYPKQDIAFIGFFMMNKKYQGRNIGSRIVNELIEYLTFEEYNSIQLAWVVNNSQAQHFWTKNGFIPVCEKISNDGHNVILASRKLG